MWMWDAVNGGFQPQPRHHNIIQAWPYPISSKIQPHLHTYYGYKGVPICPSTAYIQYGCGMQSMEVCSINHNTTTSYLRLGHITVSFPKIHPHMH